MISLTVTVCSCNRLQIGLSESAFQILCFLVSKNSNILLRKTKKSLLNLEGTGTWKKIKVCETKVKNN
jgi:hypothetical protein